MPATTSAQVEMFRQGAAVAQLNRSHVELEGRDRAQLLHGLCTNDIKRLQDGQGCEAFLTNVQGRIVGYVDVFCRAETLVLASAPDQAEAIIRNLDRYVVREKVKFVNRSVEWQEWLVGGPSARELVQRVLQMAPPEAVPGHCDVPYLDGSVSVRHTQFLAPEGFHLVAGATLLNPLLRELIAGGALPCSPEEADAARIEAGTPIYGRDITEDTLPQEVDRNSRAISFTKGCYLGQETVARIDALGHVNRLLRGLRFHGTVMPPAGAEVVRDGKVVARLTSVCFSPRLGSPLALAYVRRGCEQTGSRLASPWGEAEVVKLPLD